MRTETNTGWRKPGPVIHAPQYEIEASKDDLFAAMRLAVQARRLRPATRQVLDHMVGCYRDMKIAGRFMVWPSNEFLVERTGLVERSVRYAIRELVAEGLIAAHESANGKRFAVRTANGQIVDAYGFDLSPLLLLVDQHTGAVARLRAIAAARETQRDQITIARRQARELLLVLEEWETPVEAHWREYEALAARTPRRDSSSALDGILAAWEGFRGQLTAIYNAASGGNSCRHIEDNKDAPDQSCSNGSEMEGRAPAEVRLSDVLEACPDAVAYAGEISRPNHLLAEAARLRGGFGVSQSGWLEAQELLGVLAGPAFFVALQIYELDQRNRATIKNYGGFFRTYARRIKAGEISLADQLHDLRRRRRH